MARHNAPPPPLEPLRRLTLQTHVADPAMGPGSPNQATHWKGVGLFPIFDWFSRWNIQCCWWFSQIFQFWSDFKEIAHHPMDPSRTPNRGRNQCCYSAVTKVSSKGFSLDLQMQKKKNWTPLKLGENNLKSNNKKAILQNKNFIAKERQLDKTRSK